jgi:putative DNA-invertase from lambdoid prophage Rac
MQGNGRSRPDLSASLIRDRVRSGLAVARARGQRLGRPQRAVDIERIVALRTQGCSWRAIAAELGVGAAQSTEWAQVSKYLTEMMTSD